VVEQADFRPEPRKRLIVSGPVTWGDDAVELGSGAELAWPVSIGTAANLEVTVQPGAVAPGAEVSETWLTFAVGSNGYAGAALVGRRTAGKEQLTVAVLAVRPTDAGEPIVRVARSALVDATRAAAWVVRYNFGVISVEREGRECLIGDTDLGDFPLTGVRLRQSSGTVRLSPFRIAATGRAPARLTDAEVARRQQLVGEWQKAAEATQAALNAHNWKDCLRSVRREQELVDVLFGPDSLLAIQRAGLRGLVHTQLQELREAERVYRDAYTACARKLGPRHTQTVRLQRDLGQTLDKQRRGAEAVAMLRPAADSMRAILGGEAPESRLTVRALAFALWNTADWAAAAKALESLLPPQAAASEDEALEEAGSRQDYATALEHLARFEDAARQQELAAGIYRRVRGRSSREALHAEVLYARALRTSGSLARARELFESVREQARTGPPEAQRQGDEATFELASFHASIGDAGPAARLAQEGIDRTATRAGRDSVEYAAALQRQGGVLELLGRYAEAVETYRQSVAVLRPLVPRPLRELAASLSALVISEIRLGDFESAERDSREALRTLEEARANPFAVALEYLQLGTIQYVRKQWEGAETSLGKAAALLEPLGPPAAQSLALCWIEAAACAEARQEWDRALELEDRALELCRTAPGLGRRMTAHALHAKGVTLQSQGDWGGAHDLLRQALGIELDAAAHLLGSLSATEAVRYSETLQALRSSRLGLARRVRAYGVEAVRPVLKSWPGVDVNDEYRVVWQTKAMATRLLGQRQDERDADPATAPLRSRLATVRRDLAALYATTARPPAEALERLTRTKEELERDLARRRGRGRDQAPGTGPLSDPLAVDRLAEVLPADAVVIDFVAIEEPGYRVPLVVGSEETACVYGAYVLRVGGSPPRVGIEWVDLGDGGPIDDRALRWARRNGARARGLGPEAAEAPPDEEVARELVRSVWGRLDPLVRDARTVFLVPDGTLHLVPWAALPDPREAGRFLAERLAFITLVYGEQMLQPPLPPRRREDPCLLVGDVAFGIGPDGRPWPRLPGTKTEVERIATITQGRLATRQLEGRQASRDAVSSRLAGCRWIHLATHGFFKRLPAPPAGAGGARETPRPSGLREGTGSLGPERNPLLRCGLVFAPADRGSAAPGLAGEGVLSGEEVLDSDLGRTEAVVLSACESNVGVATRGEGLFALQRAFHLAGARTVVASLWKVDDDATAAFMEEFYRNVFERRQGKAEAFRQAQVAMLRRYEPKTRRLRPSPEPGRPDTARPSALPAAYWAAFVLSGDWR
jgi:CHAT domain-containing protein/tetratricopeptide (TPR) repeat protein